MKPTNWSFGQLVRTCHIFFKFDSVLTFSFDLESIYDAFHPPVVKLGCRIAHLTEGNSPLVCMCLVCGFAPYHWFMILLSQELCSSHSGLKKIFVRFWVDPLTRWINEVGSLNLAQGVPVERKSSKRRTETQQDKNEEGITLLFARKRSRKKAIYVCSVLF